MEGRESDARERKSIGRKERMSDTNVVIGSGCPGRVGHGQKWGDVLLYHCHHRPLNAVGHVCR